MPLLWSNRAEMAQNAATAQVRCLWGSPRDQGTDLLRTVRRHLEAIPKRFKVLYFIGTYTCRNPQEVTK